ncbi:MAG: protoporphyrinogen oxidase, partial [Pseudomonadota bacterium]
KRKGTMPSGGPSGHLTSFRGGMQTLIDRMSKSLEGHIRCNATVRELIYQQGEYAIKAEEINEPLRADAVVLACPAHSAASILNTLEPALSHLLAQIEYPPLAVVCLGYERKAIDHSLDGFGFLAPRGEGLRMLGSLWTSSIFPERSPKDRSLLRIMIGGARDTDILDLDDGQLTRQVCNELHPLLQIHSPPCFVRVFRHSQAIPQYTIGHAESLRKMDNYLAKRPGLFLTGNAYRGIGVNDCIKNAWEVAGQVLEKLG